MGTLFNGKIIKKSFFRLFTIYCWGSQSVIYKQALIAGKHQYYKYWGNPHPVPSISISIKSSAQNILFLLRPHQIQFCPAPAQPGPCLIYSPVILLSLALTLNLNVKYVAITFDIQSQFVSMMSYCPGGRGSGSSRQSEPPSNQCWVHGERVDARLVDVR